MHEFGPLRNTKLDHNHQACSFCSKELHLPTARSQSMKRALLAEETGPRHIGHWRSCWQRWQSRQTTWPQGIRTTAGRCSWQMGQVIQVPLARSGDGSFGLATWATGHVALTLKHHLHAKCRHSTLPSRSPSSTNMAHNFCSVTFFPPALCLTSSLRNTYISPLFCSFWAALRHTSMNFSFSLATNGSTKCSVSRRVCAVVRLNS